MTLDKDKILKFSIKFGLAIACYFAFTVYTVPAYQNIKVYANEKLLSNKRHLIIGDRTIEIEVADTEEKRIQGLSGREKLARDSGMLFVFERSRKYNIWMRDMQFSIDIIWMNEVGEIVHIVENASPESYPETFSPPKNTMFILELPAGFVEEELLRIGDRIDLY